MKTLLRARFLSVDFERVLFTQYQNFHQALRSVSEYTENSVDYHRKIISKNLRINSSHGLLEDSNIISEEIGNIIFLFTRGIQCCGTIREAVQQQGKPLRSIIYRFHHRNQTTQNTPTTIVPKKDKRPLLETPKERQLVPTSR